MIGVSSLPLLLLAVAAFVLNSFGSGPNHPAFKYVVLASFILSSSIFIIYLLVEYFYFGRSEVRFTCWFLCLAYRESS